MGQACTSPVHGSGEGRQGAGAVADAGGADGGAGGVEAVDDDEADERCCGGR